MTENATKLLIQERLTEKLAPTFLEIIDESHKHIGHEGAKSGGGHFALKIASAAFKGLSLIRCHQLVYQALGDAMGKEIHALKIKVVK